MLTVFVDTGLNTGVGVVCGGRVLEGIAAKMRPTDAAQRVAILGGIVERHDLGGERPLLCVEAPWSMPGRASAFGSLSEQTAVWEAVGALCGFAVGDRVFPNEWKMAMTDAALRRHAGKEASVLACRAHWPGAPADLSDDVAEAVLGALFCDRRAAIEKAQVKRAPSRKPKQLVLVLDEAKRVKAKIEEGLK